MHIEARADISIFMKTGITWFIAEIPSNQAENFNTWQTISVFKKKEKNAISLPEIGAAKFMKRILFNFL